MKSNKSGVTVTFEYDKWYDAPNRHDDVVKVIRCKDCVFWEHAFDDWGKCYGIMAGLGTYDGGFCAWAERKEE